MNSKRRQVHFILSALVILPILLLVASCYWNPQSGDGGLTVNVGSTSRAAAAPSPPSVSFARAYLYTDNMNARVDVGDGKPYVETTVQSGGGTISLDHIPAGNGYELVVTLGNKPDGSTYVPAEYGVSPQFDVVAGHETAVHISTLLTTQLLFASPSTFTYAPEFLGRAVTGVVVALGSDVGVSTSSAGFVGSGGGGPPVTYLSFSPADGSSVNSISYASLQNGAEYWLNTSTGIKEFTYNANGGFYQQVFNLPPNEPSKNVLQSGAYSIGSIIPAYGIFYQTNSGFSGIYDAVGANGPSGTWLDFALPSSLANRPVPAFAISTMNLLTYFATSDGAFAADNKILTPGDNNFAWISSNAALFTLSNNQIALNIASFALAAVNSVEDLYIGTNDGLYKTQASNVNSLVGTGQSVDLTSVATLLPGSSGHAYGKIATAAGATSTYVAAASDHVMYLNTGGSGQIIPLQAITLGTFRGVAIVSQTSTYVVVAGSEGLTYISLP